jgi:two-component system, NarL family, nitrate/nitrite response regulator NarL
MSDKLRVVLVDGQSLYRLGLSELLVNCYDFDVLGTTDNIAELRTLLDKKPDLLIIDKHVEPLDGISLVQLLRSEGFLTPAVMLTMSELATDLRDAIRVGVGGYLLKDMEPDDVVYAIRRVASGELVVAPAMIMKMVEMMRNKWSEQEPQDSLKLLTKREREILQLLSRGESNQSIALTLQISYDTVKQHVRHILNKLNLSSRVKAAVLFVNEQKKVSADSL